MHTSVLYFLNPFTNDQMFFSLMRENAYYFKIKSVSQRATTSQDIFGCHVIMFKAIWTLSGHQEVIQYKHLTILNGILQRETCHHGINKTLRTFDLPGIFFFYPKIYTQMKKAFKLCRDNHILWWFPQYKVCIFMPCQL